MSKLARVGWYWNRLRSLSVAEIVNRAGTEATQAAGRGRASGPAPVARLDTPGASWLPVDEMRSNSWVLLRADEVLAGYWRVLARGRIELGFPPEWNRNPANGVLLPLTHGKIMSVRDTAEVGDIKYLWGPNRHLELVCLAQAWRGTGQRRYLDGIGVLLESWIDQCPPTLGPNWSSALEAGVRLVNWATVWQLIGGAASSLFESPVGQVLRSAWLESVWCHAEFIRSHRSRHSSVNSNLIGELAGLFVAGVTWPCWDQSSQWRRDARAGLEAEVLAQIGPDGVDREQATGGQQFVWDCLLFAGLAARTTGKPFSGAYWQRMEAMQEYLAAIMDAGGHVPMFGDTDDAQLSGLVLGAGGDIHQSQLATAALLFGNPGLARKAGIVDTRTRWLLGEARCREFDSLLLKSAPATGRTDFPDGGTYVLGANLDTADEFRVVADAGPLGRDGIAAHGHADALSFTLSVSGREFLIDPGTGTYHGPRKWRQAFRGTAMHNTMTILNQDQAVSGGKFIWSRKYTTRVLERDSNRVVESLIAEHDGYRRLAGRPVHRRSWRLERQSASLTVVDEVIASTPQSVSLNWHFSEECHVTCTPDGVLIANGPVRLRMTLPPDGEVSILRGSDEPMAGWVSRRYDNMVPSTTLVWRGHVRGGEVLETVLKRA
ncbi:alginate lyase family protein [Zoogloea sp. LCSB751]|uniref:heparinase II/III family protein n=1 Tax=Zoogloea sp. LCSB751 TaxID=1965277 RepID=UPI0009A49A7D|nr:alginate lyase family protein [Zoogloea sp. LCSB751]